MTPVTSTEQLVTDIPNAAAALLAEAREAKAGRAGHTLVPGGHAPLKQVLLALTGGTVLADHESPGAATIHVLQGRVRLTAHGLDLPLDTGAFTAIPPVRHGVEALEDAVLLLTVAQG
jgi:quercetin dioxygenase-like cupin family protein